LYGLLRGLEVSYIYLSAIDLGYNFMAVIELFKFPDDSKALHILRTLYIEKATKLKNCCGYFVKGIPNVGELVIKNFSIRERQLNLVETEMTIERAFELMATKKSSYLEAENKPLGRELEWLESRPE
jgi:hypothetical protein